MPSLSLQLQHAQDGFSVRHFRVHEALSALFEVELVVVSPDEGVDFEPIVGSPASFQIESAFQGTQPSTRRWSGLCSFMEQVRSEPGGLSTYRLRLVPELWSLTQRRDYRVYQGQRIPEIASALLREWGIKPTLHVDVAAHPKKAYRVQYGETDFDFLSRILQEAAISFFPSQEDGTLILTDSLRHGPRRPGAALHYVDQPGPWAHREHVTGVQTSSEIRPHRIVLRDFDDRRKPTLPLAAESSAGPAQNPRYEQLHYYPGAFFSEGERSGDTPVADDRGAVRARDPVGQTEADRRLVAARSARRPVSFRTNILDLAPGVLFAIEGHPRGDLGADHLLVAVASTLEGSVNEEWSIAVQALFASDPFAPPQRTQKPRALGVQSAVVVGPPGEEIHTDEIGRVRVQFPWDRRGHHDEHSSCWVRVMQSWAGSGFGLATIPRVGQEVIVGFFEGDPDQPLVVGGVHGGFARPPLKLPEHRTVSVWRTSSSPVSGGYNELLFDDARGDELVHIHAEKDLTKIVKADETEATGRHRVIQVGERLTLTTGRASIVLDGPDITLAAEGNILVRSGAEVDLRGVRGVFLNEEEERPDIVARPRFEGDTEHYADGIDVRGPREFREPTVTALGRLQRTKTGRRVLAKMAATGQTATLLPSSLKNGYCKPVSIASANRKPSREPGDGSGSIIGFNPGARPGGAPPEVVLAFHLTQARLSGLGMRDTAPADGAGRLRTKPGSSRPFKEALATENELREELRLPRRHRY